MPGVEIIVLCLSLSTSLVLHQIKTIDKHPRSNGSLIYLNNTIVLK